MGLRLQTPGRFSVGPPRSSRSSVQRTNLAPSVTGFDPYTFKGSLCKAYGFGQGNSIAESTFFPVWAVLTFGLV